MTINSGTDVASTANFIFDATAAGDYFEFMMCGSATTCGLVTIASSASNPARPAAPAIIVTAFKNSK